MPTTILLWLLAVTVAIIFILDTHRRKRSKIPYPPGPKPQLLVGNIFDYPTIKPWRVYREWGKIYGDPIHLEVIGLHMIVVNSRELADRIFEKRSQNYSDRPCILMLDLSGWAKIFTVLLRYDRDWRIHRNLYQQGFRASIVPDHLPIVSAKVGQLLSNLRESPDLCVAHMKTYAAGVILETVYGYGYDIAPSNDRLVDIVDKAARTASDTLQPAAMVVNVFPFLRLLPLELFAFQRIARDTQRLINEMRTVPYEYVKNNMASGKAKFSLLAKFLEEHTAKGGYGHQENILRDAMTSAYAAGAETTGHVLENFFLAMAIHPEIQKRAQRELDTVLEKGATVLSNVWAMTRDESVYPDPETFLPERFLTEEGACNDDQMLVAFGFGRRICAGRHFAVQALWMAMASILSQFYIEQSKDGAGRLIKSLADANHSDGLISSPDHFHCSIKP
ncbi:cytochrome P450, partial [Marasmius fiardii PR-910]